MCFVLERLNLLNFDMWQQAQVLPKLGDTDTFVLNHFIFMHQTNTPSNKYI